MIEADIQVVAGDWRSLTQDPEFVVRRAVAAVGDREDGAPGSEVCVVLSDDRHLRGLNREFRRRDMPTNVLAFPSAIPRCTAMPEGEPPSLGDVILAFETVRREAAAQKKPFEHHMSHLVVHGTLHLLGYDHETGPEAARMEAEERAALGRLGIPDPYVSDLSEEAGTVPDG